MVFGLVTTHASAQSEQNAADDPITAINVYDAIVTLPQPSWSGTSTDGRPDIEQSRYYKDQKGPQFIFEQIPKDEEFESWTRLYAVFGFHSGRDSNIPLDAFVAASVQQFFNSCGPANVKVDLLHRSRVAVTMIVLCRDSPNGRREIGYGPGIGQVGLFTFARYRNTLLKIYQEWRGSAFELDEPDTWPVDQSELKMMIERFQTIRVSEMRPFPGQ
ncbi:MAG: hypothetical protein JJ899_03720 [Alphaproteobacteria bacterium]|nr:hypothetical protein [Alphaproteobacteria bacterium]